MKASDAAAFAKVKQFATNLASNTGAFLSNLIGLDISGAGAVVEVAVASLGFVAAAPSPPPPPPSPSSPPSPPPQPMQPGESPLTALVKDYTTTFKSNLDGCYAKIAAPRIAADIVTALGGSASLVHVTTTETATGRLWGTTCPVRNYGGRRLSDGRRLANEVCTTQRPSSCYCSTGACFQQTSFVIVLRVPQNTMPPGAAAARVTAITNLIAAMNAATFSNAKLTAQFPSLRLDAEYRDVIQFSGGSSAIVSAAYMNTFYVFSSTGPSPPPPPPSPTPPPPPPPKKKKSPPPPPPIVPMCACDQLINGASVFNTCLKIQGKTRVCSGVGLTTAGQNLCSSDQFVCPSGGGSTFSGSSGLAPGSQSASGSCKDKKGKYRDSKCAKKKKKGRCSKKKIAKKCRKTCNNC